MSVAKNGLPKGLAVTNMVVIWLSRLFLLTVACTFLRSVPPAVMMASGNSHSDCMLVKHHEYCRACLKVRTGVEVSLAEAVQHYILQVKLVQQLTKRMGDCRLLFSGGKPSALPPHCPHPATRYLELLNTN